MALVPLDIPPGVVKTRTLFAAQGRYSDADKVRFVAGKPEKWKGWTRLLADTVEGRARGAISWTNATNSRNIAIGTHLRLYVISSGDLLRNVTPIRATGTLGTNPFATTAGSTLVTVTHTNHGAIEGDFVSFSGATAVGGITIDGWYQIVEKLDNNSYIIEHSAAASSTATGGGGSVGYTYEINVGNAGSVEGLGWGAGPWGAETWGTSRTSAGLRLDLRTWSLAEYGNELLALASSGTLYLWQEQTDARAEAVTNAPASARAMFVTGERFVMLLGTTTPMTVQWPDRDDITDWTPSAVNTANSRTLQYGSRLMGGCALSDLTNLIWSDTSLYLFQYTGSEFIYDDRRVGTNCGLLGTLAFATVGDVAFWMSGHNFHMFNGGVVPIPNADDVRAYVFADLDAEQARKTWCLYDPAHNQVRWHYVSHDSPDREPDKYVDVNLTDWSWTVGTLARTCGTIYRPSDGSLIMVDGDGRIWRHETGTDADDEALEAHITFGLYALANGSQNADIVRFLPDCERQSGDLTVELYGRARPNSQDNIDEVTLTFAEGDEEQNCRLQATHFGFTVRSNTIGGDFRLGTPVIDVQSAGER